MADLTRAEALWMEMRRHPDDRPCADGCEDAVADCAEAVLAAVDAWDARQADAIVDSIGLAGLNIESGGPVLDLRPPSGLVERMATAMAAYLGDAENYQETQFTVTQAGQRRTFVLSVSRAEGQTPHALRREAEAVRDKLRALVADAIDAGASNTPADIARIRAEAGLDGGS